MKRILLITLSLLGLLTGCEKETGSNNELRKVTIEEFLNVPESSDVWYQLTGEIESIEDEEYGVFTISDETGSVYIYGMTKRKVSANDKSFSQLGLNVGDVVTLATLRTSYNGQPQGGGNPDPAYYISHLDIGPEVNRNGRDYVDLGLSALWATQNVGAESLTDFGWRYAFMEVMPKSDYTESNYNPWSGYDVAEYHWGGDWRLPYDSELKELVNRCTWDVQTVNGVEVAVVTGPNGNTIYLPFMSYIQGEGYQGWYWSSTSYSSTKAICLNFTRKTVSWGDNNKYYGFLARPVMSNPNYVADGNNGGNSDGNSGSGNPSLEYEKPDIGFYDYTPDKTSVKVQYKIYNKDEAKVSSAKIYYGTTTNPTASKSATVSGVMITANLTGLKAGTQYYVKCVATGKGGTTTTSVTKVMTNY